MSSMFEELVIAVEALRELRKIIISTLNEYIDSGRVSRERFACSVAYIDSILSKIETLEEENKRRFN